MKLPDDDDLFLRAAARENLLTPEQISTGRDLQARMRDMGLLPKPLSEICLERGFLNQEQHQGVAEMVARVKESFRIPGYKLLEKLGRGSMGTVYRARQLNLDRVVAIKILARFLAENPNFVRRFMKEARVIGKLNHPNIVQGFDAGETEGTYYFAMEYCPGPTLLEILNRGGAIDQDRAVHIATQVARALDHAYHQDLVHRDVKPDNIMIAEGGIAKLCDLGLAKDISRASGSTEKGSTMGTPNYISPEQARGEEEVDIRSDIYSLGATLYHAVAGVPPFEGPNPTVIMVKHVNEPPSPPSSIVPDLDSELERILLKMLAKSVKDRYQTPQALLMDLENLRAKRAGAPMPFPAKPAIRPKNR